MNNEHEGITILDFERLTNMLGSNLEHCCIYVVPDEGLRTGKAVVVNEGSGGYCVVPYPSKFHCSVDPRSQQVCIFGNGIDFLLDIIEFNCANLGNIDRL